MIYYSIPATETQAARTTIINGTKIDIQNRLLHRFCSFYDAGSNNDETAPNAEVFSVIDWYGWSQTHHLKKKTETSTTQKQKKKGIK